MEESGKKGLSLKKEERLHHRSLVEGLFRLGKSFYEFPFRVTYRKMTANELDRNFRNNIPEGIGKLQMIVTIPKKKRRKAVDRVLLRRRIREAYRLNRMYLKNYIAQNPDIRTISLSLVYIHDQNLSYASIEEKMKIIVSKLQKRIG